MSNYKGHRLIPANLVTLFKHNEGEESVAYKWYHYELRNHERMGLDRATTIDPWCDAITTRFGSAC